MPNNYKLLFIFFKNFIKLKKLYVSYKLNFKKNLLYILNIIFLKYLLY